MKEEKVALEVSFSEMSEPIRGKDDVVRDMSILKLNTRVPSGDMAVRDATEEDIQQHKLAFKNFLRGRNLGSFDAWLLANRPKHEAEYLKTLKIEKKDLYLNRPIDPKYPQVARSGERGPIALGLDGEVVKTTPVVVDDVRLRPGVVVHPEVKEMKPSMANPNMLSKAHVDHEKHSHVTKDK